MDSEQSRTVAHREVVFDALSLYIEEHGYAPSRQELSKATGYAVTTVRRHLEKLIAEGRVTEGSGHRALTITRRG